MIYDDASGSDSDHLESWNDYTSSSYLGWEQTFFLELRFTTDDDKENRKNLLRVILLKINQVGPLA
jgi:hypothetical protein